MSIDINWDLIVTGIILIGLGIIIYAKVKNISFKEVFIEIKELFSGGTNE